MKYKIKGIRIVGSDNSSLVPNIKKTFYHVYLTCPAFSVEPTGVMVTETLLMGENEEAVRKYDVQSLGFVASDNIFFGAGTDNMAKQHNENKEFLNWFKKLSQSEMHDILNNRTILYG